MNSQTLECGAAAPLLQWAIGQVTKHALSSCDSSESGRILPHSKMVARSTGPRLQRHCQEITSSDWVPVVGSLYLLSPLFPGCPSAPNDHEITPWASGSLPAPPESV